MEEYKLDAKFDELEKYCYLAKKGSFIEVIEWKNGEGINVYIDSVDQKRFDLTYGELDALIALYKIK